MTKAENNPKSSPKVQRGRGNIATLEHQAAQKKAKAAFLTRWREGWSVRSCADVAGVDRVTVWRWRQVDRDFDKLYRAAREDGIDVFRDIAHVHAHDGNVAALSLVLKMKGALPGDMNWEGDADESTIGAALTIEDLAQQAIEQGFVSAPKSVAEVGKELDGAGIVKVT